MGQLYGQSRIPGQPTRVYPIACTKLADGTYAIKVDTELELEAGNVNIANIKVGSIDQTKNSLRFLKVLDDGSLVVMANPTEAYRVADVDDNPTISYFGFVTIDEEYYILEENKTGSTDTYRYFKGSTNYTTAWSNRATHSYGQFFDIF